jgi:hypothetical protein
MRLPPRSILSVGDRLLSLPTFRTHMVLGDANLYLGGGTQVELGAAQSSGVASVKLTAGHLIVNAGLDGTTLTLEAGGQVRELQLGASASIAIEVRRDFVPGRRDPLAEPSIQWYLTSGSCAVRGGDRPLDLEAPQTWDTVAGIDGLPSPVDQLPTWIDQEQITTLELRAQAELDAALVSGEPVSIRLLELCDPKAGGRRTENRALAAQSAAEIGLFEPLVKSLSDVQQKAAWKAHVDTIRRSLATAPEAADQLQETLTKLRGAQAADDLMELLLGYGPEAVGATREEVLQGVLPRLVGWLMSDQLDYRVLALHNLNELTGTSSLGGYQPQQTDQQRQRAVRYYEDRLQKGTLGLRGE